MTVVCANNAADNILIVGRPCDLWLDSVTLTVTQLTKKNEQLEGKAGRRLGQDGRRRVFYPHSLEDYVSS